MRRFRGFQVVTQRSILIAVTVFFVISALVFLFTVVPRVYRPECWNEPTEKLTVLKNGNTVVDFMGCVDKAIFTNDLGMVRDEIDIYKHCNEKDRLKDYGSFLIIIPVEFDAKFVDYATFSLEKLKKANLKPVCLWRNYDFFGETTVVFEGSDKRHCIHMEDYQPDPPVKLIAEC